MIERSSSLARLVRSLRLSRRQLSLPPRELEALLLERLRRQATKRLPPLRFVTSEELKRLGPKLKAAGEIARATFMRMIDEGYVPLRKGRAKRPPVRQSARLIVRSARRPRRSDSTATVAAVRDSGPYAARV